MYVLLLVLILLASVLMCFIVLIQESKGGGLASSFASSNQIMGVRKTTDVVEKITWSLAVAMVVLSVASAFFVPSASDAGSVMLKDVQQQGVTNPGNVQGFGASAPKNAPATAPANGDAKPAAPAATPAAPAQQPQPQN